MTYIITADFELGAGRRIQRQEGNSRVVELTEGKPLTSTDGHFANPISSN
jgi:hypothetical protein